MLIGIVQNYFFKQRFELLRKKGKRNYFLLCFLKFIEIDVNPIKDRTRIRKELYPVGVVGVVV